MFTSPLCGDVALSGTLASPQSGDARVRRGASNEGSSNLRHHQRHVIDPLGVAAESVQFLYVALGNLRRRPLSQRWQQVAHPVVAERLSPFVPAIGDAVGE